MRTHWFAVMAMVACETVPAAVVKEPDVGGIARDASAERIAVDIGTLVTLRNRNTCGAGVEKARDIIKARFETLGLRVKLDEFEAPCGEPVKRQSVIGVIEGRDPTRLVMVGGHYDSRTTDRNDGTSDAPGANDSGSQTALVLEAARLMSGHKYETSVAFVAFAGEEQGLLGSKSVASHLASLFPGATLEAMLDCDIVGGDKDANDDAALRRFRLYAPGAPRETGKDTPDGPIDGTSPSRLLQRWIAQTSRAWVPDMDPVLMRREDRPGRGSDHQPFIDLGVAGVRFIETNETLAHQHSPDDVVAHVTPEYTARMTRVVVASLAGLARAPRAPEGFAVKRDATHLFVSWKRAPVDAWIVSTRPTTSSTRSFIVDAETTAMMFALDDLAPPFYVTVQAVASGERSLFAPEWRCDDKTCAIPITPADVVRKE
ncbi:MAG TPA: M28 family peptidase [Polyangiaceae bacterium]|jgi:hypothetical protein